MQYKFNTALELEISVVAHVSPAVPPRPCSDPDSPAYSDPGDPGERSVEAVLILDRRTNKKIDITDCLSEAQLEELAEQAYSDMEDNL